MSNTFKSAKERGDKLISAYQHAQTYANDLLEYAITFKGDASCTDDEARKMIIDVAGAFRQIANLLADAIEE